MSWSDGWSPVARAVAALSSIPPRRPDSLPRNLYHVAARERTAALVAHHARILGMTLPDSESFDRTATTILARQILAADQARRVLRLLGPEVIPLKGLYLAEHLYPAPGLRDMGDFDLLIRHEDIRRVDGILKGNGLRPTADLDRLLGNSGNYLNSAAYVGGGLQVHLHWHLANASLPLFMYAERIELNRIWNESTIASVAGAPCRAMAPHHLFVSLCEHALKHSYEHLIHVVDLALAWPREETGRVIEAARAWNLEAAVYCGLLLAREVLGLQGVTEALRCLGRPAGADGRWLLQRLRSNRRGPGLSALGFLSMAGGWKSKLRFVVESLRPAPAEVEGFGKRPGAGNVAQRTVRAVKLLWERLG